MRRAVTPAIPPSLYRNFAVITVVLAAGLALFADGDNRQAHAADVAEVQPEEGPSPPTIARAAPTAAIASTSDGWDEVDFDSSFGAPMDDPSDASEQITDIGEDFSPVPEGPAALSPMEREVLLRGLQEQRTRAAGA